MGQYLPEQTLSFRIYHDGTDQIGVATIDLPELSYMTESLSGAGIAGEIDSPTLGMTESMTLKMSFNSVYPEIYNMLDWTRSNLFECRAKSFPLGSLEPGKKQGNEQELEVTRLEVLLDGEEKLLIDKLNFIHRVNGTDLLATVRAQMGLNV